MDVGFSLQIVLNNLLIVERNLPQNLSALTDDNTQIGHAVPTILCSQPQLEASMTGSFVQGKLSTLLPS